MASRTIPADDSDKPLLDETPRRGGGDEVDHGEGLSEEGDENAEVDIEREPGDEDEEINPANPVTGDYEGSEPAEG